MPPLSCKGTSDFSESETTRTERSDGETIETILRFARAFVEADAAVAATAIGSAGDTPVMFVTVVVDRLVPTSCCTVPVTWRGLVAPNGFADAAETASTKGANGRFCGLVLVGVESLVSPLAALTVFVSDSTAPDGFVFPTLVTSG